MKSKVSVLLVAGATLLSLNAIGAPIYTADSVSISYTPTLQGEFERLTFQGPELNIGGSGSTIAAPPLSTTAPNTPFLLTLPLLESDTGANPAIGSAGGISYGNLNLISTDLLTFGPFVLPTSIFSATGSGTISGTVFACPANTACGPTDDIFAITFNVPVVIQIGAVPINANGDEITSADITTAPESSTTLLFSFGACALLAEVFVRGRRTAVQQSTTATNAE